MKLNQSLSLGFIGGSIDSAVGQTHKIACEMDERWKLSAGCFSQIEQNNHLTAEKWGVDRERNYSSWLDLLEQERGNLDAVAILTPTPSHAEMVIKALDLGYAVICEKALASSLHDANSIKNKVAEQDGFLALTYNYSGYPMVRELKSLIETGKLGRIQQIHIEMPQEGFIRVDAEGKPVTPQTWRLKDEEIPTVTLDLGSHTHHLVSYLTNERPLSVIAHQSRFGHFDDIVDNVTAMVRYSNDVICQMWYSKTALGHRNGLRVRVFGDKAAAEWYQLNPEELILNHQHGAREILDRSSPLKVCSEARYNRFKVGHPAGFIEAFANLYGDIADSLISYQKGARKENPYVYGIDHALEGFRLFSAMNQSSQSDKWIQLEKSS